MKKALVLLLMLAMVAPLFADDAKVLPANVLRIYTVPVTSFVTGAWDADGELTENEDDKDDSLPDGAIFSLGGAVEYGVTDQISAGFQWTPVYNFLKEADAAVTTSGEALTGGLSSVDVGAEVQIVGSQGYVGNDKIRLSLTPGVVIPMPTRDWAEEGKSAADGDDYVPPQGETLTQWAFGGLLNFDYLVTDAFYVNVFAETRFRLPRAVDYTDFYNEASQPAVGDDVVDEYEVEYGSNVFFETGLDLNYELPVSESLRVDFGLPLRYTLDTPREDTTTVDATAAGAFAGFSDGETSAEPDDPSYTLYLDPSVGMFITALPAPLEFVTTYRLPLTGQNAGQTHSIVFEGRLYLAF
jgi:hypothetical protein